MATKIGFGGRGRQAASGQRITVVPGRLALLAHPSPLDSATTGTGTPDLHISDGTDLLQIDLHVPSRVTSSKTLHGAYYSVTLHVHLPT